MSENVRWTPDQRDAIEARGGSLLVSAAAGSGKTAVLVERVLELLTDPETPVGADQLLIVTFTKAATSEMRYRLAEAIRTRLREDPENQNLRKQQMLLPSAKICTIDSFCSTLVREHFDALPDGAIAVSPDFRVLDRQEAELLEQAAVDQVAGELYDSDDDAFHSLVEQLYAGRDDQRLSSYILSLYHYSRAHPSPDGWLQQALNLYDSDDPFQSAMGDVLAAECLRLIDDLLQKLDYALARLGTVEDGEGKIIGNKDVLKEDAKLCEDVRAALKSRDFDRTADLLPDGLPNWPSVRGFARLPEMVYGKNLHNDVKKALTGSTVPKLLCMTETGSIKNETLEDLAALRPLAEKLVDAVRRLEAVLADLKAERNALDFSDVELLALSLLVEQTAPGDTEPGSTGSSEPAFVRTRLAEDLSALFAEILIDEYQDTNALQDLLFTSISRDGTNLFMVGDVKQSIYRFRQADPTIFLRKLEQRDRYDKDAPDFPAKVILGKNFRSRQGITDFVNYTFSQLMSKDVGEITYDENEMLYYGAGDEDALDSDVEFHFLNAEGQAADRRLAEAGYIAEYIGRTMTEHASDPEPLHYKDFTILLRTVSNGNAELYRKVLSEYGIPVYSDAGSGFLRTADIQIILSYLRVIDNPLQDVPLLSVLLSPLFGFTPDDLAEIRVYRRHGKIYSSLTAYAEQDNELAQKCAAFRKTLRYYRRLSVTMPSGELIRQIYEDTAFPSLASAMPNGPQRAANLQQFVNMADQYDQNGTFGLASFLRLIDRMEEDGKDPDTVSTLSPDADVVRIMTVHKSKGLQFPVCILADLDRSLNSNAGDTPGLMLHRELGIGLKGRDPEAGVTYPTLLYNAVRQAVQQDDLSETMRLLYVAMTRAQNKLVLVGTVNRPESAVQAAAARLTNARAIHPYEVGHSTTFLQWVLMVLLRHPAAKPLRDLCPDLDLPVFAETQTFTLVRKDLTPDEEDAEDPAANTGDTAADAADGVDETLLADLTARMQYEYPYRALTTTVVKRAASALDEPLFSTEYFATARPEFLSKEGLTPAQRGTCLHKFMQYADFTRAAENPEQELHNLVEQEFLTEREASVVPAGKVRKFFASDLARRIRESPNVMREEKFAVLVPASTFDESLETELPPDAAGETVLIQGIMDLAFEEGGAAVIVDYKTDRVKTPEELVDRYRTQIRTYADAMPQAIGLPVKEALLYSFQLDTTVKVPLE